MHRPVLLAAFAPLHFRQAADEVSSIGVERRPHLHRLDVVDLRRGLPAVAASPALRSEHALAHPAPRADWGGVGMEWG